MFSVDKVEDMFPLLSLALASSDRAIHYVY